LRSSRKVSKSREKEAQVKDAMQEFVQQEKNMLCKIDELSDDKHNLEMKISSIQNELNQVERALENQRV
jgi:chromosome segregation ATPase